MEYVFLALALGLALGFEFVNGFHDTANAVATVIYTHTLKPTYAVVWSGCFNLLGVLTSSGAVAFGVIALLPVELVINVGSGAGFAMVFSLLISAIMWNLGTWYLGLPASSSHTLIGSIMGVGLANSLMTPGHVFGEGVNWGKVNEVFTSLLVSPIVGFIGAGLLLLLAKLVITNPELYQAPEGDQPPPLWIRGLLMLTCTGVSFAHGSNDGQKGMGLIMLILVGILPGMFALNMDTDSAAIAKLISSSNAVVTVVQKSSPASSLNDQAITDELSNYLKPKGELSNITLAALGAKSQTIGAKLTGKDSFRKLSQPELGKLRTDMYLVAGSIGKLDKQHKFTDDKQKEVLSDYKKQLDTVTKFIPTWVKVAVAIALGLGTMIGWERIVVTVGEKIGKEHLTYAQGASAELVAMTTIGAADFLGLPVSTTHVLSSGIAGTMAANRSGLQKDTLISIATAWVLTLPACVLLGSATYAAGLFLVFHVLGLK
jgi:PiT family inorganic phosphate transporter